MHRELPPKHRKTLERHRKHLEKMIHETKRHLGIYTEGEVMHLRDRHEPRATEHGIRDKRKYTKRR